jgi:hypothetical protein
MMTEATWGAATQNPHIDWTMSAAIENVVREGTDIAEVTNLRAAVLAWLELDPEHQARAVLTPEEPILLDGATHDRLSGEAIATLAERLPR